MKQVFLVFFLGLGIIDLTLGDECLGEFTCNVASTNVWNSSGSVYCNSHFGGFPHLQAKAQGLAQHHLQASMRFLMMSTQFSYWKTQRDGFKKVFEELSDETFDAAVKIIQHNAKRGGRLNNFRVDVPAENYYGGSELEALGRALDIERELAEKTLSVTHIAGSGASYSPDGEFAHFLADEISEKQAKTMHTLAGHVNNLGSAIAHAREIGAEPSLMIYMYDTHVLG